LDPGWKKNRIWDPGFTTLLGSSFNLNFLVVCYLNTLRVSVIIMSATAVQSEVDHYMGGKRSWSYSHPPRPDRFFNPIGTYSLWAASGTGNPTTGNHVFFIPNKIKMYRHTNRGATVILHKHMLQFCHILEP
jgi:hypothetical protein